VNLSGDRIGPTAHYTGYVWARNGLSHPGLATTEGRVLFDSLQPPMLLSQAIGGPTLEAYLLARHRAIDAALQRAIEHAGITQVIEVACGLSPRGRRFANRYGERLRYIETDLPDMAARKRAALRRIGSLTEHHQMRDLDPLKDDGPGSLAAVTAELDAQEGLAIITEGLLGYLPTDAVARIWRRFPARSADSQPGATSLTSTWAGRSPRRSRPSGCCCRGSCAAASTCTSTMRRARRRHCAPPGLPPRGSDPRWM
jgi:O-methyltransferase involved in polyketide biosynthesis